MAKVIVATCPTTAIQRSWISCIMFWWPAAYSTPAAATWSRRPSGLRRSSAGRSSVCIFIRFSRRAPAVVAQHEMIAARDHRGQPEPRQRVHQVVVREGDDGQPAGRLLAGIAREFLAGWGVDE